MNSWRIAGVLYGFYMFLLLAYRDQALGFVGGQALGRNFYWTDKNKPYETSFLSDTK